MDLNQSRRTGSSSSTLKIGGSDPQLCSQWTLRRPWEPYLIVEGESLCECMNEKHTVEVRGTKIVKAEHLQKHCAFVPQKEALKINMSCFYRNTIRIGLLLSMTLAWHGIWTQALFTSRPELTTSHCPSLFTHSAEESIKSSFSTFTLVLLIQARKHSLATLTLFLAAAVFHKYEYTS